MLAALGAVRRERFVPPRYRPEAYGDHPLPIGHGQTISQPYVVALMTELAAPESGDRVLEIGTGCGYQTAVLAELGGEVWSVEIIAELGTRAARTLAELGYANVHLRHGDGRAGWPEQAPFDVIVVTAAASAVPETLETQLAIGGRLIAPVGPPEDSQELLLIEKSSAGTLARRAIIPVRFVPLTGGCDEVR